MEDNPEILDPMEFSDMEDRKPFEDWKAVRDQMPFEIHEAFEDRKAFEDQGLLEDHKSFRDHRSFGDQMLFEDKKSSEGHKPFEDNKPVKDEMPFEDHKSLKDRESFEDQKHLSPLHSNPSPSEQITTDIKAENSSESKDHMELSEEKTQKPFENQKLSKGRKLLESGTRRPLSPHIINRLEEWHQKYQTRKPPYSAGNRPSQAFKIFDRQGNELTFGKFLVSRPAIYCFNVLYPADGSQKLVASIGYASHWTFLIGWGGLEQGYEDEICAARIFGRQLDHIRYSPAIWQTAPADASTARKQDTRTAKRYVRTRWRAPGKNDYSTFVSESRKPNTPESDESSDSKPWDEGDVSLAGALVAKKRKIDDEANSLPTKGPEVVFKLVCDKSKASRAFTLNDPCPGKELFAKARQFYQLSCPDTEVNILACRIPTSNEQRYLFDGSDSEVTDFVHEMKGLSRTNGNTLLIEVEPQ